MNFKLINKYFLNLWDGILFLFSDLNCRSQSSKFPEFLIPESTYIFLGWKTYFQY